MGFPQDSALLQGSRVLVTGVTGFLASTITDQLLNYGFCVRGTVRDPTNSKASWMSAHFEERYGNGRFEMVKVEDMTEEGCFDAAIKGCGGVVHVASVVAFDPDPDNIIGPSVAFVKNILAAAEREPAVRRFVLTSSSGAVSQDKVNEVYDLTPDMWADWAVEEARAPPPYLMGRARANYYASKVLSEKAMWEFVQEVKPHFVVNSVLPDFVIGLGPNPGRQGFASSMGLYKQMFDNSGDMWRSFGAQWCVDAIDVALLHIAGLTNPESEGKRIFAYAHRKTWGAFIEKLAQMYPDHSFPEPSPDEGNDLSNIVTQGEAEDLLRWIGKPGWRPLDESLREVSDFILSK